MIEFINELTHTRMFVSPEREAEYLAAGTFRRKQRRNLPARKGLPPGSEEPL